MHKVPWEVRGRSGNERRLHKRLCWTIVLYDEQDLPQDWKGGKQHTQIK